MMKSIFHHQFRQLIPSFAIFLVPLIAPTSAVAADGVPDRCTKCHTEAQIVEKAAKMPADERAKNLDAFLTNHYTPDTVERAAIVAALKAKAEKR